jgi:hypothetical protein
MSDASPAGTGRNSAEVDPEELDTTASDTAAGEPAATRGRQKRPPEVWILVGLGLLQALGALAAAAILLYARTDPELIDLLADNDPDISEATLLATAVIIGLIGVINLILAILLAAGNRVVRAIYAVVATFQIAAATYGLVALRDIRATAIVALAYPIAVIWVLYGSKRSVRFFES